METEQTREIVIDGTFFSNFDEFFALMELLISDGQSTSIPSLENLQALLETQKDRVILLVWENADLSRITFDTNAAAEYRKKHPESTCSADVSLYEMITNVLNDRSRGYRCEVNAVDGLRMAEYDFQVSSLSGTYAVSEITEADIDETAALYRENTEYFESLGIVPDRDTVIADMARYPEGSDPANRHFVIFRDPDVIAAADIILHWPRQDAVCIDLIILSKELQGFSYGSEILRDMLDAFASCGFMWVQAGFDPQNTAAAKFFKRNWFVDLPAETRQSDGKKYRQMIRGLQ